MPATPLPHPAERPDGQPLSVLVPGEMSGRVRDAFARRGWKAVSCDLQPSRSPDWDQAGGPGTARHVQGDFLDLLREARPGDWDLACSFPPCTHLSQAGAVWWKAKQADGRQQAAAELFMAMTRWPVPHWAVENPRGIMRRLYREPDQEVEPWWFGDPLAKKTCLWTHGLPPLRALHSRSDYPEVGRVATGGGSYRTDKAAGRTGMSAHEDSEGRVNRAEVRGRTPLGLAAAMAAQWGAFIEERQGKAED